MKYKKSTEGKVVTKKDYSKRIIFTTDDFKQPGHLLQTVTIPPKKLNKEFTHIQNKPKFFIF